MIKNQVLTDLKKVLKSLNLDMVEPVLEHPTQETHGDYSTNVAMIIFRNQELRIKNKEWKNPLELADKIVERYKIEGPSYLDKIEVAPPGFINLWLKQEVLVDEVGRVIGEKEKFGHGKQKRKEKVIIEFTDPNPFKEFHIGHLYSNAVGESFSRLFEVQEAEVRRVCYQGDVGLHVAKSIWGMQKLLEKDGEDLQSYENKPLKTRVFFLGRAYVYGAKEYEESEVAKKEIEDLNIKIYQKDPAILEIWEKGRKWSLDYFEVIYQRLGTKFEDFYFESDAGRLGMESVHANIGKVFEESQGAVVFRGEKYGLHTRVFINSQGLPTYEAKELGLASMKYKDFPHGLSLVVTGNEINEYFRVLVKALSLINRELAAKTKHIPHGMVRLAGGKISSRRGLGELLTGEGLLNEVKHRIIKAFPDMEEATAEIVAVGAVKYALLKNSLGKDIIFDFDKSISLEGNSGPYLQYAYARIRSVLAKVPEEVRSRKNFLGRSDLLENNAPKRSDLLGKEKSPREFPINAEEMAILRTLYKFPEVVEEAAAGYAPNMICTYLFDLAQKFNLFYQKHPILRAEDEKREFRLGLTEAVGQVIKNGLYLLGIHAPEKM